MTTRPSRRDGDLERPVHLTDDELSAYINGEVTNPAARQQFETHLENCSECRGRLNGARVVVSLLNQAETPTPPRSFKLDPSMVRPVIVPAESWIIRVQPAMRRLTAIAAALLLVLVMADALANHSNAGVTSTARDASTSVQASGGGAAQPLAVSGSSSTESSAEAATPEAPNSAQSVAGASVEDQNKATDSGPPALIASAPQRSSPSYWRLSEFAVGVVVIWLLFLSVAFPRLQERRQP